MRKIQYLYSCSILIFLISLTFELRSQTLISDSVSMESDYRYDIYYSLGNSTKTSARINNWDLAFSTNPMDVGIRINAVNGVGLWAVPGTDTSGWAIIDSAGYQSWQELHNTDTAMFIGAFNINGTGSMADFSWGVYDFNTHHVVGDSLFLLKITDTLGNEFFKKLWIMARVNNNTHDWVFRFANLDNSGDVTVTIPSSPYSTKNFIYYSVTNGVTNDREPLNTDWDILFTRYTTDVGGGMYYPVTGIFSNDGVEVADIRPVDVGTTNSDAPYLNLYSFNMTEIGYDWKFFNMSLNTWEIEDSLVYFVRTKAGEVYKLVMTGFSGISNGNIFFDKTLISATGMQEQTNSGFQVLLYPNPVIENTKLRFYSKQDQVSFRIYDINGQRLINRLVPCTQGFNEIQLNTSHLQKGIYLLEADTGNELLRKKLIIN